jgi:2-polyprenyl-3-methyl-5-hydroxy-6-metoxy-1,4-benzoquinol methylase
VRYIRLTDRLSFRAPGEWALSRCLACRSGYLDPRPTPQAIGLAYTNYFTHEPPPLPPSGESKSFARFKAGLRHDYLRSRYGIVLGARIPLGRLAVHLAIRRRLALDRALRHFGPPGPGARLLDVGCGNGRFLMTAQTLGWEAWGIDPDREAVAAARAVGLRVEHGGFPKTGMPDQSFDAVTMSHVIEHLHDPVGALREVRRLLKPGGTVWIATPNLDSLGSRFYGRNWRGLEPPRHLVLFTAGSLRLACSRLGFSLETRRGGQQAEWIFCASESIARDVARFPSVPAPTSRRWMARAADLAALLRPELAEEVIAVARK